MIGPANEPRVSPGLDAAAIRLLVSPRVERILEPAADGKGDRRCDDDRCPPPERVLPSPGAIPFDRFLEKRNREDTVEFSLGKSCPPVREGCEAAVSGVPRVGPGERPAHGRGGDWPRLGEVSPVEERAVRRRLERVYRVTVPVRGGRIDLVG